MEYDNIIIGGGPGGLQCAYFFKKYNINYVLLEQDSKSCSFFEKYPHSGKLISINKKNTRNTNPDFNLRHDWNSLLNDENFSFTDYSDDFYPNKSKLTEYYNDFANKFELNIKYNKKVITIKKDETQYIVYVENPDSKNQKEKYICNKLIIATGSSKPNIPRFNINTKDKIKHYCEYPTNFFLDKDNLLEFKNKRVLIFGGGNSAFELANLLNEVTSNILIAGKNKKEWAMSSHYSGDIRSVYLSYYDTFLLKSLNGIDYIDELNNEKVNLTINQKITNGEYSIRFSNSDINMYGKVFDKIIFCTGWKFDESIFEFKVNTHNRLPDITQYYESANNKNLFFVGCLMQQFDYKKSSGAFIHGFRYLIESFVKINYKKDYENKLFKLENNDNLVELINYIMERINTSSHLYQMFSFIADMIFYNPKTNKMFYFKNVNVIHMHNVVDYVEKMFRTTDFILYTITLEFGFNKVTNYKEFGDNSRGTGNESKSNLIHPVIRIFNPYTNKLLDMYHLAEDIFSEFRDEKEHYEKLLRIFRPIPV
jgi:hypothetical protein